MYDVLQQVAKQVLQEHSFTNDTRHPTLSMLWWRPGTCTKGQESEQLQQQDV